MTERILKFVSGAPVPEYLVGVIPESYVMLRQLGEGLLYLHEADEVLVVRQLVIQPGSARLLALSEVSKQCFTLAEAGVALVYDRGNVRTFGPYELKHIYASLATEADAADAGEQEVFVESSSIETRFEGRCKILKKRLEADFGKPLRVKQKGK